MKDRRKRSSVYTMFSTLLQYPDRPTHKEVLERKPSEIWSQLADTHKNGTQLPAIPTSWDSDSFMSYEEWLDVYKKAMPPVRAPLQAIESVHKIWSSDPSCEMPFKNQKGLLHGDAAQHLLAVYHEIGFEVPTSFADSPDHLVLELEFMGLLAEEADVATQLTFLEQHLDWVPSLIVDAEAKKTPELYIDLLRWIESFLELERAKLTVKA
jgi:TorA maturation chaperone TorD